MCGIAVAIDWEGADDAVRAMIGVLAHRGDVDDPVVQPARDTAMATRRLRIVDGERGVQPQFSCDDRLLVSFNGEIYNHRDLRRELEGFGAVFATDSDTEVLANALRVWGAGALQRLNGMFAFVAFDLKTGEFLAARDPLGVKPLYLIQGERGWLFCSEIRPLLAASETGEVLLLPPGHALTRTLFQPYARLGPDPAVAPTADDPAVLDRLLDAAVRLRLPDGLPVATFFSGGIDSALVAHYAARHRPEAPGYFLAAEGAPDTAYAHAYAEATGYDLRTVPLDPEAMVALMPQVIAGVESFEPSTVRDALCGWRLAERAHADGFRVALCGEGADELFAGYAPLEAAYAEDPALGAGVREQCLASMHRTNLQRVDRCGMRFAVEVREPFLDPAVISYAMNLDGGALVRETAGRLVGKQPLRRLFDLHPERLPRALRDRSKIGMHRGSGFDRTQADGPWVRHAEAAISDADFRDGQREHAAYDLRSKEELFYLRILAQTLDIARVPHLRDRMRIAMPTLNRMDRVAEFLV